jgi:hypothetical protein
MAIDNTPPKLKLIVTIGVIVVVTLVGLNFVFQSYMGYMTDMAYREKLAPTKEKEAQLAAEQAAFSNAKLPIDQAMKQVAAGMRAPEITPQQSDDTGALTGWMKNPRPLPQANMIGGSGAAMPTAVATGDAGAVPSAGDAGAAMPTAAAGDAGASMAAPAGDAGAAKSAPAPGHDHH